MLERMGIDNGPGARRRHRHAARGRPIATRVLPDDIDFDARDGASSRMIGLLLIEISAFHGFAWAEAVLADTDLVRRRRRGRPHRRLHPRRRDARTSAYLQTALSEMRDRTWVGADGTTLRRRRDDRPHVGPGRSATRCCCAGPRTCSSRCSEIEHATAGRTDADDLIDEMLSLGTVVRRPTARWSTRPATPCSAESDVTDATERIRGDTMKFGIFYEHQLPRPWDERQRAAAHPGRARPGRARRPARHPVRVGGRAPLPRGVLALLGARGVPRRVPASAPRTSASATASSRPRPATTTRPAPPSGSPCSTSCRTVGSSSARASRRSEAELGGFGIDPATKREAWLEGLEVAIRCMTETPFTGVDGKFVHDAAPQRRAQAGAEAAPAAVGRVQPARHDPAGGREGHRRAELRLHRARGRRATGCTTTSDTLRREVRAGRPGRQPAGRLRDADDVRPRRGRGHRAGASRAPTSSATRSPTTTCSASTVPAADQRVGGVPGAPRQDGLLPRGRHRRRAARRSAPRSRPATRPACAARSARPTRCASSSAATRRPASTSSSSCCRRASNRHEHIMESLELFGTEVLPEFIERDEAGAAAKAEHWAPIIEQAMARKVDTAPPMPDDYVMKALPKQMVDALEIEQAKEWMEQAGRQVGHRRARRGVRAPGRGLIGSSLDQARSASTAPTGLRPGPGRSGRRCRPAARRWVRRASRAPPRTSSGCR